MPNTVSFLEVVWTFAAMLGLVVQAILLANAFGDLNVLKRSRQNGERSIIAWQNIRNEAIRLVLQSVFVYIGLLAASLPPRAPNRGGGVVTAIVLPLIYISVVVMITSGSILDFVDRRRLIEKLTRIVWNGNERRATETGESGGE